MPSSRFLISSQTLGSAAASVTFSSIPATYTDLVIRASIRSDVATTGGALNLVVNSQTSGFSSTNVFGDGTAAASERKTAETKYIFRRSVTGTSNTSNTFASVEIYIPNYAGTIAKVASAFLVTENNTTSDAQINVFANLNTNTAAITDLSLQFTNFVSGSSFYLYGIKNS